MRTTATTAVRGALCLLALAPACGRRAQEATVSGAAREAVAPGDASGSGALDAGGASDGSAGPADAAEGGSGRGWGYIRFVHVAPGVGPVRFVAVNEPEYRESRVEAVVQPGGASEYILARDVPHRVRVVPADGGADLAPGRIADVYTHSGCTVAFSAAQQPSPNGVTRALSLVTDYPWRGDAGTALLRYMPAVAGAGPFDLTEDGGVVAEELTPLEATGIRRIPPGPHAFTPVPSGGGRPLAPAMRVTVPPDEAHTLWIWGARIAGGRHRVSGLLTRDLPPNR